MELDDILLRFTINDTEEITSTGEEIGRGAYGRVFKVNYYGMLCAAKEIHSILLDSVSREELQQTKSSYLRECRQCCRLYAIQTLYSSWDYIIHHRLASLVLVQSFQS